MTDSSALSTRLGGPPFEPRWSNTKALTIGFMAGQGYSTPQIARALNDGTIYETIGALLRRAGIRRKQGKHIALPVQLQQHEFALLQQRAAAEGLAPDEWLRKTASAAIRDDLFRAIVDAGG